MHITRIQKIIWSLNSYLCKAQLKSLGRGSFISPKADILDKASVSIGGNSRVGEYCRIEALDGSSIDIGERSRIYRYAHLIGYGGKITLGNKCSVHPWVMISGPGNVAIGNHVRIAPRVTIVAGNHVFNRADLPIHEQGMEAGNISIQDDCWLGANAVILSGVTVREGSVIGAGSVVTKDTEAYGIYAGVPAKLIGSRRDAKS